MKNIVLSLLMMSSLSTFSQEKFFLYPSGEKVTKDGFEKDTEPPYFQYYKPAADSANGSAILICPGGGYQNLADQHEGVDIAKYYTSHGYAAFVLHYRLNNAKQEGHRYPAQYNDVTTAMRIIKSRAKEWKIDHEKVGVIGFSAGGHLASTLGTMLKPGDKKSKNIPEQFSTRPAFMILVYPVISMSTRYAHRGSRDNLLGKNPDPALMDSLSTEKRVTALTPPTFLVYSTDDNVVPVENGIIFYEALKRENVPASIHVYDHGGHGYGMAPKDPVLNTWPMLSIAWLKRLGYSKK